MAYVERSQLTSRSFNSRQVRKTLAFSEQLEAYRASAVREDSDYNLVRPHKSLRTAVWMTHYGGGRLALPPWRQV